MSDDKKTKTQLIEELTTLRRRILELEQQRAFTREDRLKLAIIDRAPFSMWASNRNFEIVLWAGGATDLYGVTSKEVLGQSYLELFVDPPEREQSEIDCKSIIDEGIVFRNFLAYDQSRDGTHRAILTNTFRIWDEDNQKFLQAEVGLDVSDLTSKQDQLRTIREMGIERLAEAKRREFLETFREITILIASSIFEDLGLEHVLKRFVEEVKRLVSAETKSAIYLYDEEKQEWLSEPVGGDSVDFEEQKTTFGHYAILKKKPVFIDGAHEIPEGLNSILEKKRAFAFAAIPLVSTGRTWGVWLVKVREPYLFSEATEGDLNLFSPLAAFSVNIAHYIRGLREANQKIAENQELVTRSRIAVDFVHRMNNLAGPIRNWIGLIRDLLDTGFPRDMEVEKYLDYIENEVNGLLQAADKLRQPPQEQVIDVNSLIRALVRRAKLQYRQMSIETNLDPGLAPVRAVYAQLSDAIWNVISNGLEAVQENGIMLIESKNSFQEDKAWVEITVEDSGPGISPEDLKRIFLLGYSTKGEGRGYGLWRTKQVIEEVGGRILYPEKTPDVGAQFIILLLPIQPD